MLSLDLFASPYEKPLHEGAVDDLEQRRIHDLNMKMLDLLDRAKEPNYKKNPDALAGLKREFQKVKAERDSYFGINPKTGMHPSGLLGTTKGKLDEIEPQKVPAKNQDLVTPQQRVAGATPPATTMLGKAKETFSSFVDWLAGREDKGPTYESVRVNENNPNSAINSAKYAYEQIRKAHDDNVDIATIRWMGTGEPVTMSRNQLYHTLQKLQAMSRQNRNAFALQVLADRNNFYLWLGGQKKVTPRPQLKQPTDPFQPELPLGKPSISPVQERDQKKKSSDVAAGDVKVARELQKIRAKYPAALSDIEALARNEIDSTERANQQLTAIRGANEKQDELLRKLVDLDREQGREIDNLDSENNGLEQQLARIQATNDRLQQTVGQMTGTKRSTRTPSKPITKEPSASVASGEIDPVALKKVQDLETHIQQIQAKPKTPDNQEEISNLERRLSALTAAVAGKKKDAPEPKTFGDLEVGITPAKAKSINPASRIKIPAGDLDMPQSTRIRGKKSPSPKDDDFDILSMPATSSPGVQPSTASMIEHGGGIGPRQHWQDLMHNESREINTRNDFVRERDRLLRMIELETNPANKQILRSAIRKLENQAEEQGWVTMQQRFIREDNASLPAEDAILRRIMVAHVDLLQKYGPQKVMQAAEEVAYNVGDVEEIGTSDVSIWVNQVKQILGATPSVEEGLRDPEDNPCWKGYKPVGTKKKGGKTVPNCVPKEGVAETVENVRAGMSKIYRRLAPKIDRYRDSFLAGQLYDELENYAELHGAEGEFKRMMSAARNRAHMEYDTNPGGFHNWFWFLPFEDNNVTESTDDLKKKMSKLEALALAANRAGDDAKCKMYQQKIQSLKQKLSQSMAEGWSDKYGGVARPPTPYSVYIKGKKWKDFATDDHARAVMDKLKAKFKADGRDPNTITIAPTDIPEDIRMPGTTIPQKSVIQGYTVFYNPKTKTVSVTRGGDSAEAAIEQTRINTPSLKAFRQVVDRMIDRIDSAE